MGAANEAVVALVGGGSTVTGSTGSNTQTIPTLSEIGMLLLTSAASIMRRQQA